MPENQAQNLQIEQLKVDFEREKLQLTHSLEVQKLWGVSIAVAIIVAVITAAGAVTVSVLDSRSKERELRLQAYELERQYLTNFVDHALSENIQARVDFALYVSEIAQDPVLRDQWRQYHQKISSQHLNAAKAAIQRSLIGATNGRNIGLEKYNDIYALTECIQGRLGLAIDPYSDEFDTALEIARDDCEG